MPFVKGDNTYQKLGGRSGYEIEQKQLAEMRELLSQFLDLTKKIKDGVATDKEIISFQIINKPVCKMMDKLHANRQTMEVQLEQTFSLEADEETKKMVKEFVEWRKTNNK